MFNNAGLIGHLGADPESRTFPSGSQVSRFTLYVNERFNNDGEVQERTHRFPVEVWGKSAGFVKDYLHKGSKVAVEGALAEDTWTDGEQQKHSRVVIKARRIENLTPKAADQDETAAYDDEPEF